MIRDWKNGQRRTPVVFTTRSKKGGEFRTWLPRPTGMDTETSPTIEPPPAEQVFFMLVPTLLSVIQMHRSVMLPQPGEVNEGRDDWDSQFRQQHIVYVRENINSCTEFAAMQIAALPLMSDMEWPIVKHSVDLARAAMDLAILEGQYMLGLRDRMEEVLPHGRSTHTTKSIAAGAPGRKKVYAVANKGISSPYNSYRSRLRFGRDRFRSYREEAYLKEFSKLGFGPNTPSPRVPHSGSVLEQLGILRGGREGRTDNHGLHYLLLHNFQTAKTDTPLSPLDYQGTRAEIWRRIVGAIVLSGKRAWRTRAALGFIEAVRILGPAPGTPNQISESEFESFLNGLSASDPVRDVASACISRLGHKSQDYNQTHRSARSRPPQDGPEPITIMADWTMERLERDGPLPPKAKGARDRGEGS